MPLLLPSTAAPVQSGSASLNASALRNDQGQIYVSSFCDVLFRSLSPSAEAPVSVVPKGAASTPARRQAAVNKTDPADLVNSLVMPLLTPQSTVIKAMPAGSSATAAPASDALQTSTTASAPASTAAALLNSPAMAAPTVVGPAMTAISVADQAALQRRTSIQDLFDANQSDLKQSPSNARDLAAAQQTVRREARSTTVADTAGQQPGADAAPVAASRPASTAGPGLPELATAAQTVQGPALAASPMPARRQAAVNKTDPADLVNSLPMSPLAPVSSVIKATPAGSSVTAVSASDALQTAATSPVLTAALPNSPDMAAQTDAASQQLGAGAAQVAANQPASTTGPVLPELATAGQSVQGPALAASSQQNAVQARLQAGLSVVSDNTAVPPDLVQTAALVTATATRTTDKSPGSDNKTAADPVAASTAFLIGPAGAPAVGPATAYGASDAGTVQAQAMLTPEVGSKDWNKALGQQVVHLGSAGHQVAELQLNPPGLGPLKVTLDIRDHQMQLVFVSAHASVRAAVEAAVPQLRATLADSGISLGNTSVNSESQPQAAFAQGQNAAPQHRAYSDRPLPESAAPIARAVSAARPHSDGIGVDTYA